jgi:hypothetical protein
MKRSGMRENRESILLVQLTTFKASKTGIFYLGVKLFTSKSAHLIASEFDKCGIIQDKLLEEPKAP